MDLLLPHLQTGVVCIAPNNERSFTAQYVSNATKKSVAVTSDRGTTHLLSLLAATILEDKKLIRAFNSRRHYDDESRFQPLTPLMLTDHVLTILSFKDGSYKVSMGKICAPPGKRPGFHMIEYSGKDFKETFQTVAQLIRAL